MASADYYLNIANIEGESEATGFEKQMQIESWSWGASNSGSAVQGTGLGTGKVSLQDFHFVIQNGKATPQLFLGCATGVHYPVAKLTCRKTGGDGKPYTYYTMEFNDLVISSYQEGGSNGSGILPMVQVSFNYTKLTQEYSEQDKAGQVAVAKTVSYDIKKVEGA
jgi:type VI secretion system secreted protein Hcp